MSFPHPYHEGSDADDEYDRAMGSPHLISEGEESPGDETDNSDHTPRFGQFDDGLPRAIITDWTADECAEFVSGLGLDQYYDIFLGLSIYRRVF
jgi:hypothetical protein